MLGPPSRVCLPSTWSPELLGPGKGTKCTAQLSLRPCGATENLAALTWEVHEMQGPLGIVPLQSTLEPEQCGPRKYTPPWAVPNPLWSSHYPHVPAYLLTVSLSPNNTAEQVTLNKRPTSPPYARVESRH